jgi:hypothetical protein
MQVVAGSTLTTTCTRKFNLTALSTGGPSGLDLKNGFQPRAAIWLKIFV